MTKQQAESLAAQVGGMAIMTGGNVWAVMLTTETGATLTLGCYGWVAADADGNHIIESES